MEEKLRYTNVNQLIRVCESYIILYLSSAAYDFTMDIIDSLLIFSIHRLFFFTIHSFYRFFRTVQKTLRLIKLGISNNRVYNSDIIDSFGLKILENRQCPRWVFSKLGKMKHTFIYNILVKQLQLLMLILSIKCKSIDSSLYLIILFLPCRMHQRISRALRQPIQIPMALTFLFTLLFV